MIEQGNLAHAGRSLALPGHLLPTLYGSTAHHLSHMSCLMSLSPRPRCRYWCQVKAAWRRSRSCNGWAAACWKPLPLSRDRRKGETGEDPCRKATDDVAFIVHSYLCRTDARCRRHVLTCGRDLATTSTGKSPDDVSDAEGRSALRCEAMPAVGGLSFQSSSQETA